MCGRYTLSRPLDEFAIELELEETPEIEARFNIAPTQEALIVVLPQGLARRRGQSAVWGFGAGRPGERLLINARSETVAELPSFRQSFREHRCLVPADGFYEWRSEAGGKRPYFIHLANDDLMTFAGLWQPHLTERNGPPSFTILTTHANSLVGQIHDRMPVILPKNRRSEWLEGARDSHALDAMFKPYRSREMALRAVSRQVNNVRFDAPECLDPPRQLDLVDLLTEL